MPWSSRHTCVGLQGVCLSLTCCLWVIVLFDSGVVYILGLPAETGFLLRASMCYGRPVFQRVSRYLVCMWGWGCSVADEEPLSISCLTVFLLLLGAFSICTTTQIQSKCLCLFIESLVNC